METISVEMTKKQCTLNSRGFTPSVHSLCPFVRKFSFTITNKMGNKACTDVHLLADAPSVRLYMLTYTYIHMRKTNDDNKCLMGGMCNIAGASEEKQCGWKQDALDTIVEQRYARLWSRQESCKKHLNCASPVSFFEQQELRQLQPRHLDCYL